MARAATTKLQPGEHSIDRAHPFAYRGGWGLRWRLRLPSGKLMERTTQAPTKGELRARAKRKAAELLAGAGAGVWSGASPVLAYMEAVTLPAIQAERPSEATTTRYEVAYRLLRGECRQAHRHAHSLAGLSLYDAMRPRALTLCLEEIARLHGAVNAKHAKTVAKRYLAAPLRVDEVIEVNPLSDLHIDMSVAKKPSYARGGKALSLDEYRAVMGYLLVADPRDVEAPKRGRWTKEHRAIERAAVIDIILAQANTGLRTSELCERPVADCSLDADGTFIVMLPPEATKTRTGRGVPVFDPRVSERMALRLDAGSPWLFPSPADPAKPWDLRNRNRKIAAMYQEIAEQLGIEVFEHERGHMWRTTLNTLLFDELSEAARVRLLGHTEAINRSHYTAITDTKSVVAAASILRPEDS